MNANTFDDTQFDSVILSIGTEWLTQYARFLRRSPELVECLAHRSEEFELIPVPKVLLNRLAVPGIVGSGGLGDIDPEILRLLDVGLKTTPRKFAISSRQAAFDKIREFTEAIGSGDAVRVVGLFSPNFTNVDGKGAAEISAKVKRLFRDTTDQRFDVLDIEEIHGSNVEVVARVNAAWSAIANEEPAKRASEAMCLEIFLECQADGSWKISALRSL